MIINYGKQYIDKDDIKEVIKTLKSDYLTQGPKVKEFEDKLKKYFGSKYCSVVSNGTAALHLAVLSLNLKKNDIVLTSPISFLASANSILYSGATPGFIDIDKNSYTIDPNLAEDKLKKYNKFKKKIYAIIGVDYAGHPCDWKSLKFLANKYDLKLINDNCHALGAKYKGNRQYAIKYADIVTHSYHPVKHITTGEGGAIFTNDKTIHNKILSLKNHGIVLKEQSKPWFYSMENLGFNYRLSDIQCALGISQLKKLNYFISERRKIAKEYDNFFKKKSDIIIPKIKPYSFHSYHLYPLRIKFSKFKITKIEFFKKMYKNDIKLQVHYIPIHLQKYYKKILNKQKLKLGNAINFYEDECSLPIFPGLTKTNINKIKKNINMILYG